MTKQAPSKAEIEDDCEEIVIAHPHPPGTPDRVPKHIHDGRLVICKDNVTEITMGPIGGYPTTHKYKRTQDKDIFGRPVFVEAK